MLHQDVQQFIEEHLNTEVTRLILKGSPFKDITIQDLAHQIEAKNKCKKKLPTWFNTKTIYYPNKLNIEQTSSEETAAYKADLISGSKLIDITGGFGIDSYYFAKSFTQVIHCEINESLSKIVHYNFGVLGVSNIEAISDNGFSYLKKKDQSFDCIYIDPSRRNDHKGKVFLLKDCLPYVPPKIDFFFSKSKHILIKLSPMLDISHTVKELKNVKEIHIVSVKNEVKELLFLLEKNYQKPIKIKTVNLLKDKKEVFEFIMGNQSDATYALPQNYLYEPNSAILKSGGFYEISHQYNIHKLHEHSHVYTSENLIEFPGRSFKILKTLAYQKKKIVREIEDKKANITTRNFPKTVAQLRKETKLKDGGNIYLFFTTNYKNEPVVLFCNKV